MQGYVRAALTGNNSNGMVIFKKKLKYRVNSSSFRIILITILFLVL
jgi:hypothetical protein